MSLALLVTGARGLLASEVLGRVRFEHDAFARGLVHAELDLQDPFEVQDVVQLWARILQRDSPHHRLVVVNGAAASPEQAEADEELAYGVNAAGPALLAQACAAVGARLIHVSCADVFAGDGMDGQGYEVHDDPGPRSAYGRTKLAGELAVRELHPHGGYVVRTSWLYGGPGQGLAGMLARPGGQSPPVSAVEDRWGSPTWSRDLATALLELARSSAPAGTYHCASSGRASSFELGQYALGALGQSVLDPLGQPLDGLVPARSPDRRWPSLRPGSAVLSSTSWERTGLAPLRSWQDGVQAYAASLATGRRGSSGPGPGD